MTDGELNDYKAGMYNQLKELFGAMASLCNRIIKKIDEEKR